jgi:hypothetical protein
MKHHTWTADSLQQALRGLRFFLRISRWASLEPTEALPCYPVTLKEDLD